MAGFAAPPDAPTADHPGADGAVLTLRCVLTAKTRAQYAQVLQGNTLSQEDAWHRACLLYTSDAADDLLCVDLGGRRIIKKKKNRIDKSN